MNQIHAMRSALVFVALLLLPGCDAIVGGRCRSGLTFCEGQCIDLGADSRNCGACGAVCSGAQVCRLGTCTADVDGALDSALDASIDGSFDGSFDGATDGASNDSSLDARRDGSDAASDVSSEAAVNDSALDSSLSDASASDAASESGVSCGIGQLLCSGVCRAVLSDPVNCGNCGIACNTPNTVCVEGMCLPTCPAPRMQCGIRCLDTRSDPDNCGGCGAVCPAGICVNSMCDDPVAGHLVLIGHDYQVTRAGMNRVAGNAVFLGRGTPVRVAVYEGTATLAQIAGVDGAINQVAQATGRTWIRAPITQAAELPLALANANTLVIYAQTTSSDAQLANLASMWRVALTQFVGRGGVIVLFETQSANNAGGFQILSGAGLLNVTSRADATGATMEVVRQDDAVALSVPISYRGEMTTVAFVTTDPVVIRSAVDGPEVIHRTYSP